MNYLEVFDSFHAQLKRSVLVADHDRARMLLERADGPHMVDAFLDGFVESERLVGARYKNHYLQSNLLVRQSPGPKFV